MSETKTLSYDEMQAVVSNMTSALTDMQAERDEARRRLAEAAVRRDELIDENESLRRERDELGLNFTAAQAELKTLRGEHAEACGAVARLTRERDEARESLRLAKLGKDIAHQSMAAAQGEARGLREALRLVIAGGAR